MDFIAFDVEAANKAIESIGCVGMAELVADNVLDALEGKAPRCLVPSWKE